jgi:phage gp36-like protein
MTYASKDDLIAWVRDPGELIQLTDIADPPTGAIVDSLVNAALARADNLVNSYIAGLNLDLSVVPSVLKDKACAIARYQLWSDHASERVRQDYADAIAFLKDVQAGRASLGDSAGGSQVPSGGSPKFSSADPVFSRRKMGGF